MKRIFFAMLACGCLAFTQSCSKDNEPSPPGGNGNTGGDNGTETPDTPPAPDSPSHEWDPGHWEGNWNDWSFAKGADVSYVTQMEDEGYVFHYSDGVTPGDLMEILKFDCGVNAIRLRVWVNPKPMNLSNPNIYNDKTDVLAKARRANALGLQLMIDFHFSDYWADPGNQWIPESWQGYTLQELKTAMTAHINDILGSLRAEGIQPKWVQLGNEVSWGMMWDPNYDNQQDSPVSGQPNGDDFNTPQHANFAHFIQTAYDAVKTIDAGICTVVHVDRGQSQYPAKWIFDILKYYTVDYDMIGLSLYPTQDAGYKPGNLISGYVQPAIDNAKSLTDAYGKPVIFAEVGMPWNDASGAANMIQTIMDAAKTDNNLRGIFYWEPEVNPNWQADGKHGYTLGGFNPDTNSPTNALSPFLNNID